MGLGINNDGSEISSALFFARRGANLLVTDLRKEKELETQIKKLNKASSFGNIEYVFGKHRKKDFKNADFIFKNPGVPKNSPYLKTARENKIPIINDWSVFFGERPENLLVGITGTKGKSALAALVYEILKRSGKDAALCGNIGKSPLSILHKIKKGTIVVAELSSWLLQEFRGAKKSPHIAVVTNLMPDHLDKYKNLREYYRDKENIWKFQSKGDYLILNKDDKELRRLAKKAKAKIIWFSGKDKGGAAVAVAKLLGVSESVIAGAIKKFKGIPHRMEIVRKKKGVRYFNDSAATVPDAVIHALRLLGEYKGKIILIAGGVDKKLDYKNFVRVINQNVKALILFPGTATNKILKQKINVRHSVSNTMKGVVEKAKSLANKGDIILLSPGAASFNLFKNEFDRGDQFRKIVKNL